jgi:hypothetical protein
MAPGLACPTDYQTPHPLDEDPLSGTGACTCDTCNVSGTPSCTTGAIGIVYDGNNSKTCTTPFNSLANANNGGCNTDNFHGVISNQTDIKFTPPGPTAGACTAPGATQHPNVVPAHSDTVCAAVSPSAVGCAANGWCTVMAPGSPWQECIEQPATQSCPPGLGLDVAHVVGDSVTFSCSTCGCTVQTTCTNQTVTYYTDGNCMNGALPMVADGSCNNMGANGGTYGSYKYTATTNDSCTPGTSTASNLALTNVHTICCAQ